MMTLNQERDMTKQYYPQFREKKTDFDTSDKNKNIENKKPTSYIALPTIKKAPAHIP